MDAWHSELYQTAEQGSENWHKIRAGRFTSSEMHHLMKSGTRDMTVEELNSRPKTGKGSKSKKIEDPNLMSPDTLTYIRAKVAEILTGRVVETYPNNAIQHGLDWEAYAAEFWAQKNGYELEAAGFRAFADHAGGSIDRKIKGKNEFLEVKCPYVSANQVAYLYLYDQWDLKRENPEYYWQAMSNLHFGNFDLCHFVTFDNRMIDDKHKTAYIPIKPISEDIDLIDIKLTAAIKQKLIILNDLTIKK